MKGLRKMPKFLDLGLKVVLSVSMVMGSVPTAALAEVLDDEPQVEEGVVIEEGQVDEGDLALVNDDAAAEEAVVEEVTAYEDAEPANEAAMAVSSQNAPTINDELVDNDVELVALGSGEVEADGQTKGDPNSSNNEGGSSLANGRLELYDYDYPLQGGLFFLNASVYDEAENELALGVDYVFQFAKEVFVEYDDGDGAWEYVPYETAPSEPGTYYVRAIAIGDTYKDATDYRAFWLYDINDLTYGRLELSTDKYIASDDPVVLNATAYDSASNELTEGVDFFFRYYRIDTVEYEDDEGNTSIGDTNVELAGAPSAPGNYYAQAVAMGDVYTGATGYEFFSIYSAKDLALGYLELDRYDYCASGSAITLEAAVYDAEDNLLIEGDDYTFKFYSYEHVELEGAPSEPGEYFVSAQGKGAYEGNTEASWILVYGPNDLRYGRIDLRTDNYDVTGEPVELDATVYDAAGNQLIEGVDYYYQYYQLGEIECEEEGYTWTEEGWIEFDGVPSEIGSYAVRAFAMGDSYEQATGQTTFAIVEPFNEYSLANGHIDISKSTFELGQALDFTVTISNWDYDELTQGVDYEFKYYTNEDGEELNGEPNEVGAYYVVYEGIEPYTGTIGTRFVLIEPVTPVDMALGTVDVEIASESYWIGVFTASESGYYSFYSEGDYDTDGYLYYDAKLSDEFTSDSSSGDGSNFLMTAHLYAGQTVYVKVCNCEWGQIACSVTAVKGAGLSSTYRSYTRDRFAHDGSQHAPEVVFFDSDDYVLVEGTDYRLKCFVNDNDEVLSAAPTELGSYRVVYEGVGHYLGTVEVWFEIVDGSDLSSASISLNTSHPKLIDGSINLVATVTDVAGNELVEGVHYELSYEGYNDNDDLVSVEVPTTSGEYFVKATAIEGGGYTGATGGCWFTVVDPYDIGGDDYSCYFNGPNSVPLVDGAFDLSDLTLYNSGEDIYLIQGTDFQIAGYMDENGAAFTNPPTESGWYSVVVKGAGRYFGERTCGFSLYNPNDIAQGSYDCYFRNSSNKPLVDGTFDLSDLVIYNYDEDIYLILGTDYEIAGYRDNYGTVLTNPPTEPGWYSVVVRGISSYSGERTCGFRLYDPYDLSGASVSLALRRDLRSVG